MKSLVLFFILFWGLSVRGSVGVVRGPVHTLSVVGVCLPGVSVFGLPPIKQILFLISARTSACTSASFCYLNLILKDV